MTSRTCRICERTFPPEYDFSQGRCQMCAVYWRRYGVERPPERPAPPAMPPRPCTHCGKPTARPKRGWCDACYRYWRRRSIERPLQPRPARPCQTCGQLGRRLWRDRCHACYQYWYARGQERPPRLWRRREG